MRPRRFTADIRLMRNWQSNWATCLNEAAVIHRGHLATQPIQEQHSIWLQ